PREIVVTASRSVELAPDYAVVHLGVETRHPDAARAGAEHARIATAVREALRSLGFPAESLPTMGYSVQPEYDRERNRPVGYSVRGAVEARVHDLTRVGRVIDAALTAGANRVSALAFESTRREPARLQAIELAVQAARAEAEAIARAAGVTVQSLRLASIGDVGPLPRMRAAREMAMAAVETPIQPDMLEVTAVVTTHWEFIPGRSR
ncbi:MAG TPA: SIMPL domain-containing protein, partial [Gemmatimonadales bacterium]|nr:SIMPL domain-containing protein [Gemmatimonadales bacterium]